MSDQIKFNFAEIEQLLWDAVIETFQQAMVEILSMLDKYLMATRDKKRYEYKELKERTYVTMLGTITIKRRYYWDRDEKKWVYLLDEALGLKSRDQVSSCLKELVVLWATKGPSYRDVQERLKELYGYQVLSHEKIRQILLRASDALKDAINMNERPGNKQVGTLFIEADGFWTFVQERGRKTKQKRETHLVVVHEGWERRQGVGENADYRLKNPMYVTVTAGDEESIWEQTRLRLAQRYKNLKDTQVIINGDFAPWIRACTEYFKNALYQYDRFHLKKEVKKVLGGRKKYTKLAHEQIDQNNPEGLLEVMSRAAEEIDDLEKRFEVLKLKARLAKHREALVDYRQRLKAQGLQVSPDWRGMGAAESNVDRFKLRTSKRGRAWSEKGLEAILRMLGLLYENRLHNCIKQLDLSLGERVDTEKLVSMSAARVAKAVGKKVVGIRQAGFPALNRGTQGYAKLFRSILNDYSVE
ncbi:MAG: ISLre2 family transposase [Firmicutes bacterium]|nr:ISLre2 family transposase [Bacillota bacterium]